MRRLTKRERTLALMFGGTLFLLANLIGVATLIRKQGEFQATLETLRDERREADGWLAEKDRWTRLDDWIGKSQPVLKSAGDANAELLDSLTTSAARHSITVTEQKFAELDAEHKLPYQQIAVTMKISGSLEAITRWLVEIQQPEKFQAVPSLTMKLDNDPTKIVCELTVARYYAAQR